MYFEERLGADFSAVRVHADRAAAISAGALGAKAYAAGDNLVFAAGRYRPGTTEGRKLLAHELAHVAQQRQGGTASPASAESRARSAAQTVASGGSVGVAALGASPPGLYCDPDDDRKKFAEHPQPGVMPPMPNLKLSTLPPMGFAGPQPGVMPPVPNFQLSTLPPLDYLKLQGIAGAHAQRFSMRDASDMAAEWKRSAAMLRLFGLDRGIHLGPIQLTGPELLNMGLGKQFQDRLARENPNSWDRMNQQWDQAHPGSFTIPPFPFKTWTF
jgi:hypothetical protein